jgi:hypothetical protein
MSLVWITKASFVENYRISLEFNDSKSGIVDFSNILNLPIYKELNDIEKFKNFKLNSWTLEWENGADFSPEFLYKLI